MQRTFTPIAIKVVLCDRNLVNKMAFFACIATVIAAASCPSESYKIRSLRSLFLLIFPSMLTMPIEATAYFDRVRLPTR